MRQTSFMAASAAYALTYNFPLLPKVHKLTSRLAAGLQEIGVHITSAETCMVFFDPSPIGVEYTEIVLRASTLPEPLKLGGSRLVVHIQTSPQAVEDFLALIAQLAQDKKDAGFIPMKSHTNGITNGNIYQKVSAADIETHRKKAGLV